MSGVADLRAVQAAPQALQIQWTLQKNGTWTFALPPTPPAADDPGALLAWLTCAFMLDTAHPITAARREGNRGAEGHAALHRAEAEAIRFEPVRLVNTAIRLIEALTWQTLPSDGVTLGYKAEHCRQIAHVLRTACGVQDTMTAAQETAGIVGHFLQQSEPVEGFTTHGSPTERYEAATQLRSDHDVCRYLIDSNTGEYVIRAGDLAVLARRHIGSSIGHGWLAGRMQALGFDRVHLDGRGAPGRNGRTGPHLHFDVYRGLLTTPDDDDRSKVA